MTLNTTNNELLAQICNDYRPYDSLPAFTEGYNDYEAGKHRNPYEGDVSKGVQAQAWDRGANAAMRYRRATDQRYR
jgi:hypothetical protein